MNSQAAFGSRLQKQRVRLGVSVESIARTTRVSRSLFEALERGDLSRWPRGIYRRAFLRQYARAIGLPAEPLVAEALRLFPDAGDPQSPDVDPALRLTLVPEPRWPGRARQGLAAVIDSGAVLLSGYGLSALSGTGLWTATAVAALSYHAAGTIVLGQSLAGWCLTSARLFESGRRARGLGEEIAALQTRWVPDVLKAGMRSEPAEAREEAVAFGRSGR